MSDVVREFVPYWWCKGVCTMHKGLEKRKIFVHYVYFWTSWVWKSLSSEERNWQEQTDMQEVSMTLWIYLTLLTPSMVVLKRHHGREGVKGGVTVGLKRAVPLCHGPISSECIFIYQQWMLAGEFSSPGSTFCADSYFGIRSNLMLLQ